MIEPRDYLGQIKKKLIKNGGTKGKVRKEGKNKGKQERRKDGWMDGRKKGLNKEKEVFVVIKTTCKWPTGLGNQTV